MTSGAVKHGPDGMLAPPSASQTSMRVLSAAQAVTAGRTTSSQWSAQPLRVENRGSSFHSGCPTSSARASNWCSRATCIANQPSAAWKLFIRTSSSLPRLPRDQKFVTTSAMASMASSIAMSTTWPLPVRSR